MRLPLSLDSQRITQAPGIEAELTEITAKRSARTIIAIPVTQNGSQVTEESNSGGLSGLQLRAIVKDSGDYDGPLLIAYPVFAWVAERNQYEAPANFNNPLLNKRLGVDSAAVTITGGDSTTNVITTDGPHGLAVNDRIYFPELAGGAGITAEDAADDDERVYYYVKTVPTSSTFTLSATQGGATLDFTSTITSGTVRYSPVDVASISPIIELQYRFDSGDEWTPTENEVELTLKRAYGEDDGEPESPEAVIDAAWLGDHGAVIWGTAQTLTQAQKIQALQNILFLATALTGGAAGALDSIVTASSAVATGTPVMAIVSGELSFWQLQAGTTAEDSANGIVRPDDYNGATNARIWIKVL